MKTLSTILICLFSLQIISAQTPAKEILLETKVNDFTGFSPIDYNNDGWTDYLGYADNISVLFENSGGEFWADKFLLSGFADVMPVNMFAQDVDLDGLQDIVCIEYPFPYYDISWFKNPGNTTAPWEATTVALSLNAFIGLFDVDGDDDPDLVYENSGSYLYWKENVGGVFSYIHSVVDSYPSLRIVTTYDFDKDNDMDWSAYFYDYGTVYFENNNDGTFTSSDVSTDENQDDIYVGDVNGDGFADIVVNDAFNYGVAYFDTIAGDFDLDIAWEYYTEQVEIDLSDMDDDGDDDWIIFEHDPVTDFDRMKWIESTGEFVAFDDAVIVIDSIDNYADFHTLSDFNNDNKTDLFTEMDKQIQLYENAMPTEQFLPPIDPDSSAECVRMDLTSIFDVDGDGDNDLMVISDNGKLGWFENDVVGDSLIPVNFLPFLPASPYPTAMEHADFDSDGDEDLVAGFRSFYGGIQISYYFINDGTGNFTSYFLDSIAFKKFWFMDADADGENDLVGLGDEGSQKLVLYLNNPGPAEIFSYYALISTDTWVSVEMADIDNDGDQDFFGSQSGTAMMKKIINADGAALFGTVLNFFNTSCTYPIAVFSDDFDLDADDDIAYSCPVGGYSWMAVNDGGAFTPISTGSFNLANPTGPFISSTIDLNGDGFRDFYFSDFELGTEIKLSSGPGTFESSSYELSPDFGVFGNINNDAFVDFSATNQMELYVQYDFSFNTPSFTIIPPVSNWLVENGSADGMTIYFNEIPQSEKKVIIDPTGSIDAGNGEGEPLTISFMPDSTALVPQYIQWMVPDDLIVEDVSNPVVSVYNDPLTWGFYDGMIDETYSYIVTDNELALYISPDVLPDIEESENSTVFVHINMVPASASTLTITPEPDMNLGMGVGVPFTIPLNADQTAVENNFFSINIPDDYFYELTHEGSCLFEFESTDPAFEVYGTTERTFTIIDDEILNIDHSFNQSPYYEEGDDEVKIKIYIFSEPYSDLTVIATPDEQLDLGNGAGTPAEITFIADSSSLPEYQSFYVEPVQDFVAEPLHTGKITFELLTDDPFYAGLSLPMAIIKIKDNESTSLEEVNQNAFSVSPTIGSGFFQFETNGLNGEISLSVFNLSGEEVYHSNTSGGNSETIDLSDHATGIYTVVISNGEDVYVRQIEIIK